MQIVQGIDPVAHPPPPVVPSFQRVLDSGDSSGSRFTNGKGQVVGRKNVINTSTRKGCNRTLAPFLFSGRLRRLQHGDELSLLLIRQHVLEDCHGNHLCFRLISRNVAH